MKGLIFCMAFLFATRISAQTVDRSLPIPSSFLASYNRGFEKSGHHVNSAEITTHLVEGNFNTVTGHFNITCPNGSDRSIEMVFTPHPMSDSVTNHVRSLRFRSLSVDEATAAFNGDRLLLLDEVRFVSGILKGVCLRPEEQAIPSFYIALSLWVDDEGRTMRVYQHVNGSIFSQLK